MFGGWFGGNTEIQWKSDDLPTPTTDEEYRQLAEKALSTRLSWLNSSDWTEFHELQGFKAFEKPLEGSSISLVRCEGVLKNVDFEKLVHSAFGSDLEERKRINPDIVEHDTVEEIDDKLHIGHSKYAAPTGVSAREFVALRHYRVLDDGRHVIVIQSINYEGRPHSQGYVRGSSNCATFFKKADGNEVHITTIDHIEPRGWVPATIVNSFKKKAVDRLIKMQEVYTLG